MFSDYDFILNVMKSFLYIPLSFFTKYYILEHFPFSYNFHFLIFIFDSWVETDTLLYE